MVHQEGCGLEEGGPPCYLPIPAQFLRFLGQFQEPGYPGGLWCGAQVLSPTPTVSDEAEEGGAGGRVLQSTLLRRDRG